MITWEVVWRGVLLTIAGYALYLAALTPSFIDQILVALLVGACAWQFVASLSIFRND